MSAEIPSRWWHMPLGILAMILAVLVSGVIINVTCAAIEGTFFETLLNWISQAYMWITGLVVAAVVIVSLCRKS